MSFGKGHHLHLIDGSGFIFRAYHALPPLTRKSDGLPVGAVAGFCNMVFKMVEDAKGADAPTHVAVIFDHSGKTFRSEIYPEYKAQRPEPWDALNARIRPGEHLRAFPLSNWTELDVWRYVQRERIDLPELYFAHVREVFRRDGMLLSADAPLTRLAGEEPFHATVRYRTVGDMTCTGAIASTATSLDDVIAEVIAAEVSERGASRADDTTSEAAMEDRKREGYF